MNNDPVPFPHGTEELRNEIHEVLKRYPELTISETVGALEIIKSDILDLLKGGAR